MDFYMKFNIFLNYMFLLFVFFLSFKIFAMEIEVFHEQEENLEFNFTEDDLRELLVNLLFSVNKIENIAEEKEILELFIKNINNSIYIDAILLLIYDNKKNNQEIIENINLGECIYLILKTGLDVFNNDNAIVMSNFVEKFTSICNWALREGGILYSNIYEQCENILNKDVLKDEKKHVYYHLISIIKEKKICFLLNIISDKESLKKILQNKEYILDVLSVKKINNFLEICKNLNYKKEYKKDVKFFIKQIAPFVLHSMILEEENKELKDFYEILSFNDECYEKNFLYKNLKDVELENTLDKVFSNYILSLRPSCKEFIEFLFFIEMRLKEYINNFTNEQWEYIKKLIRENILKDIKDFNNDKLSSYLNEHGNKKKDKGEYDFLNFLNQIEYDQQNKEFKSMCLIEFNENFDDLDGDYLINFEARKENFNRVKKYALKKIKNSYDQYFQQLEEEDIVFNKTLYALKEKYENEKKKYLLEKKDKLDNQKNKGKGNFDKAKECVSYLVNFFEKKTKELDLKDLTQKIMEYVFSFDRIGKKVDLELEETSVINVDLEESFSDLNNPLCDIFLKFKTDIENIKEKEEDNIDSNLYENRFKKIVDDCYKSMKKKHEVLLKEKREKNDQKVQIQKTNNIEGLKKHKDELNKKYKKLKENIKEEAQAELKNEEFIKVIKDIDIIAIDNYLNKLSSILGDYTIQVYVNDIKNKDMVLNLFVTFFEKDDKTEKRDKDKSFMKLINKIVNNCNNKLGPVKLHLKENNIQLENKFKDENLYLRFCNFFKDKYYSLYNVEKLPEKIGLDLLKDVMLRKFISSESEHNDILKILKTIDIKYSSLINLLENEQFSLDKFTCKYKNCNYDEVSNYDEVIKNYFKFLLKLVRETKGDESIKDKFYGLFKMMKNLINNYKTKNRRSDKEIILLLFDLASIMEEETELRSDCLLNYFNGLKEKGDFDFLQWPKLFDNLLNSFKSIKATFLEYFILFLGEKIKSQQISNFDKAKNKVNNINEFLDKFIYIVNFDHDSFIEYDKKNIKNLINKQRFLEKVAERLKEEQKEKSNDIKFLFKKYCNINAHFFDEKNKIETLNFKIDSLIMYFQYGLKEVVSIEDREKCYFKFYCGPVCLHLKNKEEILSEKHIVEGLESFFLNAYFPVLWTFVQKDEYQTIYQAFFFNIITLGLKNKTEKNINFIMPLIATGNDSPRNNIEKEKLAKYYVEGLESAIDQIKKEQNKNNANKEFKISIYLKGVDQDLDKNPLVYYIIKKIKACEKLKEVVVVNSSVSLYDFSNYKEECCNIIVNPGDKNYYGEMVGVERAFYFWKTSKEYLPDNGEFVFPYSFLSNPELNKKHIVKKKYIGKYEIVEEEEIEAYEDKSEESFSDLNEYYLQKEAEQHETNKVETVYINEFSKLILTSEEKEEKEDKEDKEDKDKKNKIEEVNINELDETNLEKQLEKKDEIKVNKPNLKIDFFQKSDLLIIELPILSLLLISRINLIQSKFFKIFDYLFTNVSLNNLSDNPLKKFCVGLKDFVSTIMIKNDRKSLLLTGISACSVALSLHVYFYLSRKNKIKKETIL
jgi:hypothetical protein